MRHLTRAGSAPSTVLGSRAIPEEVYCLEGGKLSELRRRVIQGFINPCDEMAYEESFIEFLRLSSADLEHAKGSRAFLRARGSSGRNSDRPKSGFRAIPNLRKLQLGKWKGEEAEFEESLAEITLGFSDWCNALATAWELENVLLSAMGNDGSIVDLIARAKIEHQFSDRPDAPLREDLRRLSGKGSMRVRLGAVLDFIASPGPEEAERILAAVRVERNRPGSKPRWGGELGATNTVLGPGNHQNEHSVILRWEKIVDLGRRPSPDLNGRDILDELLAELKECLSWRVGWKAENLGPYIYGALRYLLASHIKSKKGGKPGADKQPEPKAVSAAGQGKSDSGPASGTQSGSSEYQTTSVELALEYSSDDGSPKPAEDWAKRIDRVLAALLENLSPEISAKGHPLMMRVDVKRFISIWRLPARSFVRRGSVTAPELREYWGKPAKKPEQVKLRVKEVLEERDQRIANILRMPRLDKEAKKRWFDVIYEEPLKHWADFVDGMLELAKTERTMNNGGLDARDPNAGPTQAEHLDGDFVEAILCELEKTISADLYKEITDMIDALDTGAHYP